MILIMPIIVNRSTGHTHTHTPTENNTPDTDTHAHDKNNTPNEHLPQSLNNARNRTCPQSTSISISLHL